MTPRANLSVMLVVAGLVLLVAIAVGNEMGNRVLGQATERGPAILATPIATPASADTGDEGNWRRNQIVTVATDPAFPDPRVTPEPPPPPPVVTARPTPAPTPIPSPTESREPYTSPPLPIPLVSHTPAESESPDQGSPAPTPR
jgi:hypothetical protein